MKYYGSDEARYDLQKKEDDLKKTSPKNDIQANDRTISMNDNGSLRNSENINRESFLTEKRALRKSGRKGEASQSFNGGDMFNPKWGKLVKQEVRSLNLGDHKLAHTEKANRQRLF